MLSQLSLPLGLALRPADESDQDFSEAVFFSTREHFYQLPFAAGQLEILLKQQFQLQQTSYTTSFPLAETYIIEQHRQAIGKLMIDTSEDCLQLIDIALLGHMRGKGYGSALLCALKNLARQHGLRLQLSVDQQNTRAKKLYLDLGFRLVGSSATHDQLCWQ